MLPVLLSIGPINLYSLSTFIVIFWLIYSFIYWKILKDQGINENPIFEILFQSSIFAFVFSRLTYVFMNWSYFKTDPIRIFAIWIVPGLSFTGALSIIIIINLILSHKYKIKIYQVFDALSQSLWISIPFLVFGTFLDGTYVGKVTTSIIGIHYLGHQGIRWPVQIIEILVLFFSYIIFVYTRSIKRKYGPWYTSFSFFIVLSILIFSLEFIKESAVYFLGLTILQWISIAIFSELSGIIIIKSGFLKKIHLSKDFKIINIPVIKNNYEKFIKFTGRLAPKNKENS